MNPSGQASLLTLALIASGILALVAAVAFWRDRQARQNNSVLEESLAAYRMMFDSNPNPMYVYDVDTFTLLAVNQTLCDHYGYAPEDLVGGSLMQLHIEPERARLREVVTALRESRDPNFRYRWLQLKKSGESLPVEIVSRPLMQSGENARLVVAIDISEKLRAEEEIANQHQFRESLLETLPVPVFYKDRDGHYLGVNQAFITLLGQSREFFVGRTARDIAPKELAAIYDAADEALYATPESVQTYAAQIKSGTLGKRDVIFTKAVFRDFRGNVGGLVGTVIDVTEQLASERAVRESESRLAQILHNSPLPVFVIDTDHKLLVWNPACERTFGISAKELLGTNRQWSAFYPSERPCMADIVLEGGMENDVDHYYHGRYHRSQLNPEAFEAEDFFPSMGEGGRWLYFTASPLRDAQGRVVGAIETLVDISERKRAEREVQQLNERLEAKVGERTAELGRANEELRLAMKQLVQTEKLASLGSLVAGVAHELNTPLGNVITVATSLRARTEEFATLLASGEGLRRSSITDFTRGCLDAAAIVERNATRAGDLIGSFKEVAVDQTSMRRRQFDLGEVIREILSALHPTLRRTAHEIDVEVSTGIMLDSYPGPLEQVLSNLIMNSLLHGFEHTPAGRITIRADEGEENVRLHYSDNGSGMTGSIAQQAFDPFFTTKLGKGGSGLGLYIVYNLVSAVLGGSIRLDSEPGKGVAFEMVLPKVAPRLVEHGETP
jgi:PAS domain S-box-containing protein